MPSINNAADFKQTVAKLSRCHFRKTTVRADLSSGVSIKRWLGWVFHFVRRSEVDQWSKALTRLDNLYTQYGAQLKDDEQFMHALGRLRNHLIDRLDRAGSKAKAQADPLRNRIKALVKQAFAAHMQPMLDEQRWQVRKLEKFYNANKEQFNAAEQCFLERQLGQWQQALARNKPIVIPKWYHCTKNLATMQNIAKSHVKVMHQGMYPGAFVSNTPEVHDYGRYCLVFGERIEAMARQTPLNTSNCAGQVRYGGDPADNDGDGWTTFLDPKTAVLDAQRGSLRQAYKQRVKDADFLEYHHQQEGVRYWYGFKEAIQTRRPAKKERPLEHHKNRTLGYLAVPDNQVNSIGSVDAAGRRTLRDIDNKVEVIALSDLEALNKLYCKVFPLALPAQW